MNRSGLINRNRQASVLVTGGAGFIGSHVSEALYAQGWHVVVLDNLSSGSSENVTRGPTLNVGDIRSDRDVRAVFEAEDFDAVVHCAAQTSVSRSMLDPELDREVNVAGTQRLASMANEADVRRFVFLSSGGAIYGETEAPATECTPPAPRSYYGLHKYVAEELLRASEIAYGILRPSNVYGPRQRADAEGGVIATFLERLVGREPLEIHGTGHQVRDFVHVSDVVAAVVAALATDDNVLWNVASGEAVSVLGLAGMMAELAHRPAPLSCRPRRAGDVDCSLVSAATLIATGLWGPPLPLASGLRLTLAQSIRGPLRKTASASTASCDEERVLAAAAGFDRPLARTQLQPARS